MKKKFNKYAAPFLPKIIGLLLVTMLSACGGGGGGSDDKSDPTAGIDKPIITVPVSPEAPITPTPSPDPDANHPIPISSVFVLYNDLYGPKNYFMSPNNVAGSGGYRTIDANGNVHIYSTSREVMDYNFTFPTAFNGGDVSSENISSMVLNDSNKTINNLMPNFYRYLQNIYWSDNSDPASGQFIYLGKNGVPATLKSPTNGIVTYVGKAWHGISDADSGNDPNQTIYTSDVTLVINFDEHTVTLTFGDSPVFFKKIGDPRQVDLADIKAVLTKKISPDENVYTSKDTNVTPLRSGVIRGGYFVASINSGYFFGPNAEEAAGFATFVPKPYSGDHIQSISWAVRRQ